MLAESLQVAQSVANMFLDDSGRDLTRVIQWIYLLAPNKAMRDQLKKEFPQYIRTYEHLDKAYADRAQDDKPLKPNVRRVRNSVLRQGEGDGEKDSLEDIRANRIIQAFAVASWPRLHASKARFSKMWVMICPEKQASIEKLFGGVYDASKREDYMKLLAG